MKNKSKMNNENPKFIEESSSQKLNEVFRFFPSELRQVLLKIPRDSRLKLIEIRMRINQPLELNFEATGSFISPRGDLTDKYEEALIINNEQLRKTLNAFTTGSFYALEDQINQGYLALPGGHRVGITGQVFYDGESIRLVRNISSINFRIARSIRGIARPVLPFLWKEGRFLKTIIIGAPATGKTTLLREIIREISSGAPSLGIPGIHVGLVDERSEIAGSYQGIPQLDIGPRTDVLDGCSKRDGVYLLLRAMNPHLIATDEVGREEDFRVIEDIINAGVSLLATAHAQDLTEATLRPGLKKTLQDGMIERVVLVSNRLGIGTVESIKSGISGPELLTNTITGVRGCPK
jgi:stage III sporulation protein AA